MLALVLGVTASFAWGGASIFGGQAARFSSAFSVAWWYSIFALPWVLLLAVVATGLEFFAFPDFAIGVLAGAAAVIGGTLLFVGLAKAPASSVAPSSGIMSALLPVTVASFRGEELSELFLVGVGLAVAAIWLISFDGRSLNRTGLIYGIGSGTSFGVQFAILGFVGTESGLWPIVGVFVGASILGSAVIAVTSTTLRIDGSALGLTVGAAACSVAANTSYLYATRLGSLSTAAVLAALYAIPTVLLAALFLREGLLSRHWLGLAVAGLATALISI